MTESGKRITLDSIRKPVEKDLVEFQKEFESALRSEVSLINIVSKYLLRQKGKQIRPVLSLLSARMCGEPSRETYIAASLIELIHLATLVHDDIVDGATLRRGWTTINRIWKNKIAVLMGDYILSKSLINMVKLKNFKALEIISRSAEELSAGEILQMEKNVKKSMDEEVYFRIIYLKTATLFSTTCELGSLTTTEDNEKRNALSEYGRNLGMAFQIKDDLFDLLGSESATGKNLGADVKKNMKTLPVIHAVEKMSRKERSEFKSLMNQKHKSGTDLARISASVEEKGGYSYAKQQLENFSTNAIESLGIFEESEPKKSLIDLTEFNKNRKR